MATTKTKEHKPVIDDDFLAGIKAADNVEGKAPATAPAPKRKAAEPAAPSNNEKKVLCNFKINENTLKAWKQFCIDHDTNVTDAIKRAMNYYIKQVNNDNVDL